MFLTEHLMHTKNGEIIADRSLTVAQDVVDFLKLNYQEEGIFRLTGHKQLRQKILGVLLRGDRTALQPFLRHECIIEIAAAFQLFLQYLKQPLLPVRVQELLAADNPGIPAQVVAEDALGLLYQDLPGRHLHLLKSILELLHAISKTSHRSELTSLNLPIVLLPTFFNINSSWSRRWYQVALTFQELIMRAPGWSFNGQKSDHNLNTTMPLQHNSFQIFEPRHDHFEPIPVN